MFEKPNSNLELRSWKSLVHSLHKTIEDLGAYLVSKDQLSIPSWTVFQLPEQLQTKRQDGLSQKIYPCSYTRILVGNSGKMYLHFPVRPAQGPEIHFSNPLRGPVHPVIIWLWHPFQSEVAATTPGKSMRLERRYVAIIKTLGTSMFKNLQMNLQHS